MEKIPALFARLVQGSSLHVSGNGLVLLLFVFLAQAVSGQSPFHFTDVSESAGLIETYDQNPENFRASNLLDREFAHMTGGAVAGDFDGDGWIDLYVLRGGLAPNLFYRNRGDGNFAEEAVSRGIGQAGRHSGVCGADYDSDGDLDLFVSALEGPHLLLVNDGTGHFTTDPTAIPRLTTYSTGPSWTDIDRDGLLDLAIGSWSDGTDGTDNALMIYRNTGPTGFRLFQYLPVDWTFAPHFADLNGDGAPDLVAVADFGNTRFFMNDGRGILIPSGGSDIENGMGAATADLDLDGDLDLFMTAIMHPDPVLNVANTNGNRLLVNDGHGKFTEVTTSAGVRSGYWAWGPVFGDFENDGDEDLFQVNGFGSFQLPAQPWNSSPALLFENLGDLTFREVASASGEVADDGQGRCTISFDYDKDGDLDLFIANNNRITPIEDHPGFISSPGRLVLLRNDSPNIGNWLRVTINGSPPYHSDGMGTRIRAKLSDRVLVREINASTTYNGHGSPRLIHFGTGNNSLVEWVEATFPNGDSIRISDVAANQKITMDSPRGLPEAREVVSGEEIRFEFPEEEIPRGGQAVWTYNGLTQPNPGIFPFGEAGYHQVTVQVFNNASQTKAARSETFRIKVKDPNDEPTNIARIWNETALDAIRIDFPNPAVHARNLFHLSVAMWDAWAAYDPTAIGYLHRGFLETDDPEADRREAISHAAYHLLSSRYQRSTNASASQLILDFLMRDLGYPISLANNEESRPAALGKQIARTILNWSKDDGSLEENDYRDPGYRPANRPLVLAKSGTILEDPNRWQPLQFEIALSQNGLLTLQTQIYAGSQWGSVRPFALSRQTPPYLDPGSPPRYEGEGSDNYRQGTLEVVKYSSWLDPDDGVMMDISPRSNGLNPLGFNDGQGHGSLPNPATGLPYHEQWVRRADYGRVIAEYWADGPNSETPPGHWNAIANQISDHPELLKRFRGQGRELDPLEWHVKLYFALNAALHDAAIAAWDCKRHYDYVRPISSIRHLSELGDLPEAPGLVEKITLESSRSGGRHAALIAAGANIGDTALFVWGGEPDDPESEFAGNRWIAGVDWLPYQRSTFVTPAFAGYVSGHSTFSRAGAEVLATFTGSPYFPGGMSEHHVPSGSLEFEFGPSSDLILQWATYFDAADEAGLSRLYGGIHFPVDDGPGRIMGSAAGLRAMALVEGYFNGSILQKPIVLHLRNDEEALHLEAKVSRGLSYSWQSSNDLKEWLDESPIFRALEDRSALSITPFSSRNFYRLLVRPDLVEIQ